MNQEKIKAFAEEQNYNYLGSHDIEVVEPLNDEEKLELGQSQAEALCEIDRLESLKKQKNAEFKELIDVNMKSARDAAKELNEGNKRVGKSVPCYYDPEHEQRVYVDIETGEEVKRGPAQNGDAQMKI